MADGVTGNYGWSYPTNGADASTWGNTLNATIINIDAVVGQLAATTVAQGGGVDQGTNRIHLGWSLEGAALRLQVDTTDTGYLLRSTFSSGAQGVRMGGAVTITSGGPAGTPNDGDFWVQYS